MMTVTPYLHFNGDTEEAMQFYKSVFGGEFTTFARFRDIPGGEKMAAADQHKIIHIALEVSKAFTIMATDMLESMGQILVAGNTMHICVHPENASETERIFNALSGGGSVEMPLNKTFFSAYFGMCRDRYGIQWMINCAAA